MPKLSDQQIKETLEECKTSSGFFSYIEFAHKILDQQEKLLEEHRQVVYNMTHELPTDHPSEQPTESVFREQAEGN